MARFWECRGWRRKYCRGGCFCVVSGYLQLAAIGVIMGVYFLQPGFGGLDDLTTDSIWRVIQWLPSYWFLALYQQLNGSLHPALEPLARRAWIGLAGVVCVAAVAYTLSYWRTLRKIVEEPDIGPGSPRFELVAAIRDPGSDRDRTIQRAHAGAQQAASPDSGVLSGNRSRHHQPHAERISGRAEQSMARGEHAAVGRKHHDDGAGRGGDAGGVRPAAGSAGQLDFPRDWNAGWFGNSGRQPACAAFARRWRRCGW